MVTSRPNGDVDWVRMPSLPGVEYRTALGRNFVHFARLYITQSRRIWILWWRMPAALVFCTPDVMSVD